MVFLVSAGLKSLLQKVLFQLSRKALKTLLKLYASENTGRENASGKPRCEKRLGGMEESKIKEQRRQKNKLSAVTNSSAIYQAFTLSPGRSRNVEFINYRHLDGAVLFELHTSQPTELVSLTLFHK